MVFMMPVGLYITGRGDILKGSGSTAVLWAVIGAIVVGALYYRIQGLFNLNESVDLFFEGVGGLMPMAVLMVLAFSLGATCKVLGTGDYIASQVEGILNPIWVPGLAFLVSAFTAFSTGTSFGTFAIMIPIFVPMALTLDARYAAFGDSKGQFMATIEGQKAEVLSTVN